MEELYNRGEIDDPPDTYHYTILCGAYARSGRKDAASRVLQILSHMIELSSKFAFKIRHVLILLTCCQILDALVFHPTHERSIQSLTVSRNPVKLNAQRQS